MHREENVGGKEKEEGGDCREHAVQYTMQPLDE